MHEQGITAIDKKMRMLDLLARFNADHAACESCPDRFATNAKHIMRERCNSTASAYIVVTAVLVVNVLACLPIM